MCILTPEKDAINGERHVAVNIFSASPLAVMMEQLYALNFLFDPLVAPHDAATPWNDLGPGILPISRGIHKVPQTVDLATYFCVVTSTPSPSSHFLFHRPHGREVGGLGKKAAAPSGIQRDTIVWSFCRATVLGTRRPCRHMTVVHTGRRFRGGSMGRRLHRGG